MILIGGFRIMNNKKVSMETLETLTDLLERAEDYYHYNNLDDKRLVINKEDLLNIVTDLKLGQ